MAVVVVGAVTFAAVKVKMDSEYSCGTPQYQQTSDT